MSLPALLAVDWGTSSLRGALLDKTGAVLEMREFTRGILTVSPGEFESVFNTCFGDWMQTPGLLCLMSGMVGSRQAWQEAPYCPCPAGFAELARHAVWLQTGRIALVPGLSCLNAGPLNIPDVMRGEEVQIFGALHLAQRDSATLVLPGTHSKWVQVERGRVTHFKTYMTGEVYALLCKHSILGKTLDVTGALDKDSFLQGIDQSQQSGSVLHQLFAVRTLGLFNRMPASALSSYLSGLLIGEELRTQTDAAHHHQLILVGNEALTMRYALALSHLNIDSQCLGAQATWAGLFALAATLTGTP